MKYPNLKFVAVLVCLLILGAILGNMHKDIENTEAFQYLARKCDDAQGTFHISRYGKIEEARCTVDTREFTVKNSEWYREETL